MGSVLFIVAKNVGYQRLKASTLPHWKTRQRDMSHESCIRQTITTTTNTASGRCAGLPAGPRTKLHFLEKIIIPSNDFPQPTLHASDTSYWARHPRRATYRHWNAKWIRKPAQSANEPRKRVITPEKLSRKGGFGLGCAATVR